MLAEQNVFKCQVLCKTMMDLRSYDMAIYLTTIISAKSTLHLQRVCLRNAVFVFKPTDMRVGGNDNMCSLTYVVNTAEHSRSDLELGSQLFV